MNITAKAAGQRLGVTKQTVNRLGRTGQIKRVKVGGGKLRNRYKYIVGSINEFMKSDEYRHVRNRSKGNKKVHTNGTGKLLTIPQESVATGIKTRLGNLEDEMNSLKNDMIELVKKVNHLIQIWS